MNILAFIKGLIYAKADQEDTTASDDRMNAIEETLRINSTLLSNQLEILRQTLSEGLQIVGANIVGLGSRHENDTSSIKRLVSGKIGHSSTGPSPAVDLYLSLLEKDLTGILHSDGAMSAGSQIAQDPARRAVGFDWPATAVTMIGLARLQNIRALLERAIAEGVDGDFIETGVWRGGACIYAKAIISAHGGQSRKVFVADSFQGLPPPNAEEYPADQGDTHFTFKELSISKAEVQTNFKRYGLLDDNVVFLEGWFKDTLPSAPIDKLSVLRLDGDMYESTIQALDALYHKVSPGGFVIVDDYILPNCAKAVDEFRFTHGITAELHPVDGAAMWWQVPR